jgi:hypothetical protein
MTAFLLMNLHVNVNHTMKPVKQEQLGFKDSYEYLQNNTVCV